MEGTPLCVHYGVVTCEGSGYDLQSVIKLRSLNFTFPLMKKYFLFLIAIVLGLVTACSKNGKMSSDTGENIKLDSSMLRFTAYENNPVFSGTDTSTWDRNIRERGFILFENDTFHLWYTGYATEDSDMHLGYATSTDGINWSRYSKNPIIDNDWVEDMMVTKKDGIYYMFAEGRNDIAHLLTSTDRVHWTEQGNLDIRQTNGDPLTPGPYGTPAAWFEDGTWYLLYERGDLGIWLATSEDLKVWQNAQDEPVLTPGPEPYDKYGVAVNQIVKRHGVYYAYYHATAVEDWSEWSSCVAVSTDRIHWHKYAGNPILRENKSSPVLVEDGSPAMRLYTMHPAVALHWPQSQK